METASLETFREVAVRGSFTGAGQALGYTQSAVSRQVSTLEHELGAVLFDRMPRGVLLTEEGRLVLGHVEAMLDRLTSARDDLADLHRLGAGRVRVGAFPTANAALVPRALASFQAAYPSVTLSLEEAKTPALAVALHAGDIDVAVVSTSPHRLLDGDQVDLHALCEDPLFVALPPRHRFVGRAQVRLGELADETWVAGNPLAQDTLLGGGPVTAPRPRIDFVAAEWIAKQALVAAGLGITLVPSVAVTAIRSDLVLAGLHPGDVPDRYVYAATPRGRTMGPAVAAFVAELERTADDLRYETGTRGS